MKQFSPDKLNVLLVDRAMSNLYKVMDVFVLRQSAYVVGVLMLTSEDLR